MEIKRNLTIDVLRVLAIVLMIFAHANALLFTDTPINGFIQSFADQFCFVAFLFCFAASFYYSLRKNPTGSQVLLKVIGLYGIYLFTSLIYLIANNILTKDNLLQISIFQILPSYGEFFAAFILYEILMFYFSQVQDRIFKIQFLIPFSIVLFFLGALLSTTDWMDLNFVRNLIVGYKDVTTFPIFQYSIILILGLFFSHYFTKREHTKFLLITFLISGFTTLILYTFHFDSLSEFLRWPPSFLFIIANISILTFATLLIEKGVNILEHLKHTTSLKPIILISHNGYNIFWLHLIIIYTLRALGVANFVYIPLIVTLVIILVILFVEKMLEILKSTKLKHINLKPIIISSFMGIVALFAALLIFVPTSSPLVLGESTGNNIEFKVSRPTSYIWLDSADQRYIVKIDNNTNSIVKNGSIIAMTLPDNTNTYKIVKNDEKSSSEVASKIIGNKIYFKISSDISVFSDDYDYVLYKSIATVTFSENPKAENVNTEISNVENNINISLSRKWIIIGDEVDSKYNLVTATNADSNLKWSTDGKVGIGNSIDLSSLTVGDHKVYLTQGDITKVSEVTVSYPLYVAWTIDYEGMDVANSDLKLISDISNTNKIPVTHFFNPRIYLPTVVSKQRSDELTKWILERKAKGDEIALHLHMFYDMVEAAGVNPLTSPTWSNRGTGSDVPTSAYSAMEFKKILDWGIKEFKDNGLGTPQGFRAGGWFIDLKNLKVVQEEGISYDSSGRETYSWGTNKLAGFWDLNSKSQPYLISNSNQNSTSSYNTGLLELPNNGAESTSQTAAKLISNYHDNFNGTPLKNKEMLTVLSHAQGFNKDAPRINELFKITNKSSAGFDTGPVIYITLDQALTIWK